ncbi:MAG: hypothetical protein AB1297_05130, partial [bacterium]
HNTPPIVLESLNHKSTKTLVLKLGSITAYKDYRVDVTFELDLYANPGENTYNQASITYTGSLANETYLCNNVSKASALIGTPTINLYIIGTPMWGDGMSGEERLYSFLIYNDGTVESGATMTITFDCLSNYLSYVATNTSSITTRLEPVMTDYGSTWTLQWVIDPNIEDPESSKDRVTIGGPGRRKVGTPKPNGMPWPFFVVNTKVGDIPETMTLTIEATITPYFLSKYKNIVREVTASGDTIIDTLTTFSPPKGGKVTQSNKTLEMASIPPYIKDGGFIFYCIRFENNTNLSSIELKDILPEGFGFSSLEPPVLVNRNRTSGMVGSFTFDKGTLTISFQGSIGTSGEIWLWGKTKKGMANKPLENQVSIRFNGGTWNNLQITSYIDEIAPIIKSLELLGTSNKTIIATWLGEDPSPPGIPPSGITKYILYAQEKGCQQWQAKEHSSTQTTFVGEQGKAYSFYVVAIDRVGNKSCPSEIKTFQIIPATYTAINLKNVIIFPNPYRLSKHRSYGINFRHLTEYATIRIFNIKGELVKRIEVYPQDGGFYIWRNPENELASGVYIYIITNPDGDKCAGKLGIIK